MTPLPLLDADGVTVGRAALAEAIAGQPIKQHLIHETVVAELAARRAGTHSTKTRGEVRGGGAKPWRQKGTGRARQGSIRAPHWTGGGVAFGPTPRSHGGKVNRKVRQQAFRAALRAQAERGTAAADGPDRLGDAVHQARGRVPAPGARRAAVRPLLLVVEDLDARRGPLVPQPRRRLRAGRRRARDGGRGRRAAASWWSAPSGSASPAAPSEVEAVEPKPKPKPRKPKPKPKPKPKAPPEPAPRPPRSPSRARSPRPRGRGRGRGRRGRGRRRRGARRGRGRGARRGGRARGARRSPPPTRPPPRSPPAEEASRSRGRGEAPRRSRAAGAKKPPADEPAAEADADGEEAS